MKATYNYLEKIWLLASLSGFFSNGQKTIMGYDLLMANWRMLTLFFECILQSLKLNPSQECGIISFSWN
jgi:hypothetical protein